MQFTTSQISLQYLRMHKKASTVRSRNSRKGYASQEEPEVDVDEMTLLVQHEVTVVPVLHPEDVAGDRLLSRSRHLSTQDM